jgi:hypothetical protein
LTGPQVKAVGRGAGGGQGRLTDLRHELTVISDRLLVQCPFAGWIEPKAAVGAQDDRGAIRRLRQKRDEQIRITQRYGQPVLLRRQPVRRSVAHEVGRDKAVAAYIDQQERLVGGGDALEGLQFAQGLRATARVAARMLSRAMRMLAVALVTPSR